MKFAQKIVHLVFPGESNNQKAKLLHTSGILGILLLFLLFQVGMDLVSKVKPGILGYAANISPSEVIRLTNEKRAQAGLSPLTENPTLSSAALAKGADMLNRDYWSHIAPDGTEPWKFFTNVGYKYRYAGENLARDFSNPSSAIDAWMASPTHKENILSSKYKEIGIAVVEGDLAGADTTIIVQFFGTKYTDTVPAVPIAEAKGTTSQKIEESIKPTTTPIAQMKTDKIENSPLSYVAASPITTKKEGGFNISAFNLTKNISLAVIVVFLLVLIVDGIEVGRRKIIRVGGKNFAHISYLLMILIIALIIKAGKII